MFKKIDLKSTNNISFVTFFGLVVFINELNYFRFSILESVIFLPRLIMILFLIYVFFYIKDKDLKNFKFDKKNVYLFILFYTYITLSFIIFNRLLYNPELSVNFIKIYIYDLVKYFFIYIFYCLIGVNLIKNYNLIHIFKIFLLISFVTIACGLFFMFFYKFTGFELIKRLFYYNDPGVVGFRFFSFFGEPRNASVAMLSITALSIIFIQNLDKKSRQNYFVWVYILCILAMLCFFLTKSFTGILALIISLGLSFLIILHHIYKSKIINYIVPITLITAFSIIAIYLIANLDRSAEYLVEINNYLKIVFEKGTDEALFLLSDQLRTQTRLGSQMKDVFPILNYIGYLIELDFVKILFGNGSFASYYVNAKDFVAPHSYLARLLFDNGVIGLILLTLFVFSSITKNSSLIDKIVICFSYGGFLSLNSTFLFIIIMFNLYFKSTYSEKNDK